MRRSGGSPLIGILLLLVTWALAACGSDSTILEDPAESTTTVTAAINGYVRYDLDEVVLDGIFVGTVGELVSDGTLPEVDHPSWYFHVEEVLWLKPEAISTEGDVIRAAPAVTVGDEIVVLPRSPATLVPGTRYVLAGPQIPSSGSDGYWFPRAVYDPVTMEQDHAVTEIEPALDELLLEGEEGPEDKLTALVEIADQRVTWSNATNRGEPAVPGPRLARAHEIAAKREAAKEQARRDREAARLAEYLALPPEQRQLDEGYADAVEALDLIRFSAVVIYDDEFLDAYNWLGMLTAEGYVGPYRLPDELVVTIDEMRPRSGDIRLIVWPGGRPGDDFETLEQPVVPEDMLAEAERDDLVIVVDLTVSPPDVSSMSGPRAANLVSEVWRATES